MSEAILYAIDAPQVKNAMDGALKDNGLHVHSERTNGKYPYDAVYTFLPL